MEQSTRYQVSHMKPNQMYNDSNRKTKRETTGSGQEYEAAGIKSSLHGYSYQLKLLMLFAKRGLDQAYTFTMATEVKEAEKFDDLIFQYDNEDKSGTVYRFLQAKHMQDENKKITLEELLKEEKGNFSLQKYFISYRNILNNSKFKGENVTFKDFIICTNIDIDDKLVKIFKEIDSDDNILNPKQECKKKFKRLKIVSNDSTNETINKLITKLKSTSDQYRLARKICDIVYEKKGSFTKDELLKKYSGWLFTNVFYLYEEENKRFAKFNVGFFFPKANDVRHFQEAAIDAYLEKVKRDKPKKETILKQFELVKIEVPMTFKIHESNSGPSLIPDLITDNEIKGFFDKLVFAVNQPNEVELGNIFLSEICEETGIKQLESVRKEIVASTFQNYVFDWVKAKEVHPLSTEDVRNFFAHINLKFASFALNILTSKHMKDIEEMSFDFQDNENIVQEVRAFLEGRKNKQILIIYQKSLMMSKKKVFHAYQKVRPDCIFTDFKTLEAHIDKFPCPANVFGSEICNVLISDVIYDYQYSDENINANNIIKRLIEILMRSPEKRIIFFISQEQQEIVEKCLHDIFSRLNVNPNDKMFKLEDNLFKFGDFSLESQNKLLNEETVMFQGREVTLGMLIGNNWQSIFPENNYLAKIIESELINELISGKLVDIGNTCTSRNYEDVRDYYIERSFYRQIIINKDIKQSKSEFIISYKNIKTGTNRSIVLISDKPADFSKLCKQYPNKNIHWLKNTHIGLIWQQSQGSILNLRKYLKKNDEDDYDSKTSFSSSDEEEDTEDSPMLLSANLSDRVAIISAEPGMGKSTVLTHLAMCMTQELNVTNQWVVVINLVDQSDYFKELQESKAIVDLKQAIKFIYRTMGYMRDFFCIEENGDLKFNFSTEIKTNHTNIYEVLLFNYYYNQGKVALLLDGFDEISPNYKCDVLNLLETLKETKLQKLWVTTRPYNIKSELENRLDTFSYSITAFSEEETIFYMKKYWESELGFKIDDNDFYDFHDQLNNQIYSDNFMDIPLHVKMICMVFKDNFREFVKSKKRIFNLELCVYTLYKDFFNVKFNDILYGDLNKSKPKWINLLNKTRKDTVTQHGLLGLFELFSKDILINLLSEHELSDGHKYIKAVSEGEEKTGIIDRVIDEKPHFVHRSYAEYFSAELLADMLISTEKCEAAKQFLYNVFLNENYIFMNIFKFLNHKLVNGLNPVFTAALYGNVQKVIRTDNCCEMSDGLGRTPIHLLCTSLHDNSYQNRKVFNDFLNIFSKLSDSNFLKDRLFGWTPLHYLCTDNDDSYFCTILSYGNEYLEQMVSIQDINGKTPLFLAIRCKCEEIVDLFQRLPKYLHTYLNSRDNVNKTLLEYILENYDEFDENKRVEYSQYNFFSNITIIESFTEEQYKYVIVRTFERKRINLLEGDVLNLVYNQFENFIADLIRSMLPFDNDFALKLLYCNPEFFSKYFDINIQDSEKNTPLHYAARDLNENRSIRLLELKADANKKNGEDQTPLDILLSNHCENIEDRIIARDIMIKNLIESGAYFDEVTIYKYLKKKNKLLKFIRRLFRAVKSNDVNSVTHILKLSYNRRGGNVAVNARTKHGGKTLLHYAAQNGNMKMVECLLSHGAFYNVPDNNNKTPLDLAGESENIDSLLNLVYELFDAVVNGNIKIVKQCTDRLRLENIQSVINCRDYNSKGLYPLQLAVQTGHFEIVKILIEGGAIINVTTTPVGNVFHIAFRNYHRDVFDYLLQNVNNENDFLELFSSGIYDEREYWMTPIDMCVKNRQKDIAIYLTKKLYSAPYELRRKKIRFKSICARNRLPTSR